MLPTNNSQDAFFPDTIKNAHKMLVTRKIPFFLFTIDSLDPLKFALIEDSLKQYDSYEDEEVKACLKTVTFPGVKALNIIKEEFQEVFISKFQESVNSNTPLYGIIDFGYYSKSAKNKGGEFRSRFVMISAVPDFYPTKTKFVHATAVNKVKSYLNVPIEIEFKGEELSIDFNHIESTCENLRGHFD